MRLSEIYELPAETHPHDDRSDGSTRVEITESLGVTESLTSHGDSQPGNINCFFFRGGLPDRLMVFSIIAL